MNPVVIGNATLYLGDCLEILPTLPKVDAVVADPVYGNSLDMNYKSRGRGERRNLRGIVATAKDWDAIQNNNVPFDPTPWLAWKQVILWGGNWFCSRLPDASCWLIWDKRKHTPPDHNADAELAWTNLRGPVRVFTNLWRGMLREGEENMAAGPKVHPMQKPIALMRWCVDMTTGDVLDPFMGSGTTGVACMNLGRKFIGIEIEPKYFDIACERIDNAQRQARMFG
jgi:site-specific DNA-methyltransferase (adenine-specific)/modification methylase